jgi:ATP-dependent Lhr-like helicase
LKPSPEQVRTDGHSLKSSLPRTWGAFFRRYGNFTSTQLAAIPSILAGENLILCAPTASGKTEAALAPLIELYLPAEQATSGLTILYILPTRALISDLWARIQVPLETLRISCAVKTHDSSTFNPERPADILLTTPESLDALMSNQTKLLARVRAVVLDELHTFDGILRGDQLRVLLNRLREVRTHAANAGDAADARLQVVALSATISTPRIVAERYFENARVLEVPAPGKQEDRGTQGNWARAIEAELISLEADTVGALLDYLGTFRARGWRKALAFCNTRAEVEKYASAIRRGKSPFGDAVYVHYSNLGWERRREIEQVFAQAESALCFASSTLELGIDVGDIDVTLLIGPPGSVHSFVQRVGRANRRRRFARVACFYRTPLERITFGALLEATVGRPTTDDRPQVTEPVRELAEDQEEKSAFRPSVAIQQIFSLLKQSPTGAVRLNPLSRLFEGMLSTEELRRVLGTLQAHEYLASGRPGEWRAGERLNRLVDMQATEYSPLSLHSNIEMEGTPIKIRDRESGRVVAAVDRQWFDGDDGDVLTLEGRPLNVEWYDGESLWVSMYRGSRLEERANAGNSTRLRYLSTRQTLSYDLAARFPAQLGLSPGVAPLAPTEDGWLWFHWLGDVYGRAILDLLAYTLPVGPASQIGLCLLCGDEPRAVPAITPAQVERYLQERYRAYEPMMALGAYHHLLPVELRRRAVVEQFNVPRFLQAVQSLRMERASEALTEELHLLIRG